MPTLSYPGTPGTTLYAGLPTPSVGGLITTLSLVNTSGSTQAANFVSPMFGQPFVQGDLPTGEYPVLTLDDDTPVAATFYNDVSWPDSSKKFCGVILRSPASIAGSGTQTISVKGGGSAPSASSRTLSDLAAADISIELTGIENLSGVWVASLNTAITDATDIVVIGDGPAGKVWRIGGDFKQTGTAHGQLYCWHYVASLQDASGNFMGIRYLGRCMLPYVDVASPAATRLEVSGVLKSGATTIRTFSGHDASETPGSTIGFNHYSSFYTCGTDGKWDYIQGGGSASADCTVRVVHDKTYFIKTRMVAPYRTDITPTSMSSVDYLPYALGSWQTRAINTTGNSNFIGVLPEWAICHLMTQAAVDERAVRVSSLAAAGHRITGLRESTKQVLAVVDIQASYTGLGTIATTARFGPSVFTGVSNPTDKTSLWSGETDPSHRGSAHYYPYLITAEPQYLDMLTEVAAYNIASVEPGTYTRNVGDNISSLINGSYAGIRSIKVGPSGSTYKGAGLMFLGGGVRQAAWALRDITQCISVLPDAPPDGADVKGYLTDVANSCAAVVNDINSQMPTSWQDSGLFSTTSATAAIASDGNFESPWMTYYLNSVVCLASQTTGIASVATLRTHLGKFISSLHAIADVAALGAYRWQQWGEDGYLVDDIANALFLSTATLTFDAGTNTCTVGGSFGDWSPTNGDKFAFESVLDADKPFAEAVDARILHAIDCSGQSMKLSLTPGGSVIPVTSSVTVGAFFMQIQDASPRGNYSNTISYLTGVNEAACFHEACGDSYIASARTQISANLVASGHSFTADPRNALASSYPV